MNPMVDNDRPQARQPPGQAPVFRQYVGSERSSLWPAVMVGAGGMLILVGFIGTCIFRDPNTELAKTAHSAVELAQQAQQNNDAAYLWPGRLRLLAVVLGVSIPIAAAAVLAYVAMRYAPGKGRDDADPGAARTGAGRIDQLPTSASAPALPPAVGDPRQLEQADQSAKNTQG